MKPHPTRLIAAGISALTVAASLFLAPMAMAAKVDISSPQAYLKSVAPMAQANMKKYGVPASVAIAQSIQETGWGKSSLSVKGNAYFGIKCSKSKSKYASGCINAKTWEVYDGERSDVTAAFRRYAKPEHSFLDHGHFLRSNPRYAKAFKYTKQPKQFISEVRKAGYATDPAYTSRIIALMDKHNLYKYDTVKQQPTKSATPTKSAKPTKSATPTKSPKPSATKSPKPSATASPTQRPKASATAIPTPKPTPKSTAKPTVKADPPVATEPPVETGPPAGTDQPLDNEPPAETGPPAESEQAADPDKAQPADVPPVAAPAGEQPRDHKSGYPVSSGGLANTGA